MKVNDQKIISYIKYLPFYFVIATSIIYITFVLVDNHFKEENEKLELKKKLEIQYKNQIKNETLKIVDFINVQKDKNKEELVKILKEKNDTAYDIVRSIYDKNKDKNKQEIIELIKNALDKIRFFNGRGYYYIIGLEDGYCYFHPVFKSLENRSLLEIQDAKGLYLTKEMIKIVKTNDEGYLNYHWYKEGDKTNQYEKIAYLKKFEPLGIYIVSSDYVDALTVKWKSNVESLLTSISFKDETHFFIINKKTGLYDFHKNPNLIGKDFNSQNHVINPQKLILELNKPNSNGLYKYNIKGAQNKILEKTSYFYTIEDWDWIIGIGYLDENIRQFIQTEQIKLENYHSHNLMNNLIFMIIVSIAVLLFSKYFSNIIERRFKIYNFSINRKIVEIGRQQRIMAQQSKMAAMGEMIENIAHQWRQPLSIISTAATGLKISKEFNNLDDETFFSSLKSINDSSQYLSNTIEDFRNYYQKSNETKDFRIDETIEKCIQLLKPKIDSNNIEIIKDIKKLNYYGNENELLQVLMNLLNNSCDQFHVTNNVQTPVIKIKLYKNIDTIFIEVSDNAGGIDSEIIERIFEPYFTTKNKNIGTGIGLYMSKNIIEKSFNGKIDAKNIVLNHQDNTYNGAKFTISLN